MDSASTPTWIFQVNPKDYNIDGALAELSELTWRVTRFRREVNRSDGVFIWRAGENAGIIAEGRVATPPDYLEESAEEERFYLKPEKFISPRFGVQLRIERVLPRFVPRHVLKGNRRLAELTILRAPQGTNFRVTAQQAATIRQLVISRDFPDELEMEHGQSYLAGGRRRVWVNAFERDPKARDACLKAHGYRCAVCGFLFEERYGNLGKGFIHVHHLKPLSLTTGTYQLDPITDLRPVCPNCHAMLHQREPILTIEQLRAVLRNEGAKAWPPDVPLGRS
jgi:hypothetical protein